MGERFRALDVDFDLVHTQSMLMTFYHMHHAATGDSLFIGRVRHKTIY